MIYIVAGNLRQAHQCATKNRLHEDLWRAVVSYDQLIGVWRDGDKLWFTGTYSWNIYWNEIKSWAIKYNIELINKV